MEASSTTINIVQPEMTEEQRLIAEIEALPRDARGNRIYPNKELKHTHMNTWGRYVAGCPKCEEMFPAGEGAEPAKKTVMLDPNAPPYVAPVVQATAEVRSEHIHPRNFGRYVAGCPRCEDLKAGAPTRGNNSDIARAKRVRRPNSGLSQLKSDGEPKQGLPLLKERIETAKLEREAARESAATERKIAEAKAETEIRLMEMQAAVEARAKLEQATAPTNSAEIAALKAQIELLMARQNVQTSGSSTDELVKIMLRREAETIQKEEVNRQRIATAREDMLRIGREQELVKAHREASCGHTKPNGVSAICASQIHNDGYLHPFCQRCGKTWARRRPSGDLMPTSVDA